VLLQVGNLYMPSSSCSLLKKGYLVPLKTVNIANILRSCTITRQTYQEKAKLKNRNCDYARCLWSCSCHILL